MPHRSVRTLVQVVATAFVAVVLLLPPPSESAEPAGPRPQAAEAARATDQRVESTGRPTGRRNPAVPLVRDPPLLASPAETFIGPPGTTNPFAGTQMTENQCRDMERCQVVQGQGPSFATWCRCGKGKLTTFTYIHD